MISVYPNVATNQLTVTSNQLTLNKIQIVDVQSRIVYQQNELFTGTKTIDISGLQSGMYFINFVNGNKSFTRKFIKE